MKNLCSDPGTQRLAEPTEAAGLRAGSSTCRNRRFETGPHALAGRSVLLVIHCLLFCCQASFAPGAVPERESFFAILTNCPPITRLLLEAKYYSPQMTSIEFRYQPGAFYARQLSDAEPSPVFPPTTKDMSCGYLDDAFWFLRPGAANKMLPILTTGVEVRQIRPRYMNNMFESIFSLYVSFGISPEGVNSVKVEGNRILAVMNQGDARLEHTYAASLVFSNGLPVSGQIQPNIPGHVKARPFYVRYNYHPEAVPLPFPSEIVRTVRAPKQGYPEDADLDTHGEDRVVLHLVVKELEVGDRSSRLPPEVFTPSLALLAPKYEHIVITNGESFRVAGTKLIPLDASHSKLPPPPFRGQQGSRRWVIVLLFITVFLVPFALFAVWKRGQHQNQKGKVEP